MTILRSPVVVGINDIDGANDNAVMVVMQFESKQAKAERADYDIQ